jgi:tRNA threonylcarbamoyladenosine biosynthesis protein TsaE
MRRDWISRSEEETRAIAVQIARSLPRNAIVELRGDLGAGKTTMARAMAEALGANPLEVSSPSFALVHEYPLPDGPAIVHIDGYRLSGRRREWDEIGIPEMLRSDGVKFVEWPKTEFGHSADYVINLRVEDDEARVIELRAIDR